MINLTDEQAAKLNYAYRKLAYALYYFGEAQKTIKEVQGDPASALYLNRKLSTLDGCATNASTGITDTKKLLTEILGDKIAVTLING